ncbi:SRPBCC domain-containing protein [Aureibacillus halotolerans]|uniref:Uncharacterized protein YndB with AHSA1/START domain n=1 Tax=Aureibacillus halotolerans TaxID=1508390 RepID=A0A4R6U0K4_9BACI|nr:SRPBCC domain-containing protein [Aureibacillus halotolerans]TDQ36584.1 uncharacterized protein YndB with AHSA1/START domain [Aureibacillus halotolerans]
MTVNSIVSKVEGNELTMERVFQASRELVFQCFSEEEHLKNWFGPKGWPLAVCNIDFRVGGVWHYCMKCTDETQEHFGMEAWGRAVYKDIVTPERIKSVDQFSNAEGTAAEGMPESIVTQTFVDEGGKTKLIQHTVYDSPEALQSVLDMGMLEGTASTWDNFEEYVQKLNR